RPIWNAACNQAGVPGLHFHDLRHVGGTMAAATGASLMIYQHATQDRDEAIAKALGGLWSQVHPDAAGSGRRSLTATVWPVCGPARLCRSGNDGQRFRLGGGELGVRVGAGEGNRTLMTSLEGWGSAIELRPHDELPPP